jgi:hypothetical protein
MKQESSRKQAVCFRTCLLLSIVWKHLVGHSLWSENTKIVSFWLLAWLRLPTLTMWAVHSSKISVDLCQTTQYHISDQTLQSLLLELHSTLLCHWNLKPKWKESFDVESALESLHYTDVHCFPPTFQGYILLPSSRLKFLKMKEVCASETFILRVWKEIYVLMILTCIEFIGSCDDGSSAVQLYSDGSFMCNVMYFHE